MQTLQSLLKFNTQQLSSFFTIQTLLQLITVVITAESAESNHENYSLQVGIWHCNQWPLWTEHTNRKCPEFYSSKSFFDSCNCITVSWIVWEMYFVLCWLWYPIPILIFSIVDKAWNGLNDHKNPARWLRWTDGYAQGYAFVVLATKYRAVKIIHC
jgi:hypothetical protein